MRFEIPSGKAIIILALIALLAGAVIVIAAEAQRPYTFKDPFSQSYGLPASPLTRPGDLYSRQPTDLTQQSRCPYGYYPNPTTGVCVPIGSSPGSIQACPAGYYYNQHRGQCVPYSTAQRYAY